MLFCWSLQKLLNMHFGLKVRKVPYFFYFSKKSPDFYFVKMSKIRVFFFWSKSRFFFIKMQKVLIFSQYAFRAESKNSPDFLSKSGFWVKMQKVPIFCQSLDFWSNCKKSPFLVNVRIFVQNVRNPVDFLTSWLLCHLWPYAFSINHLGG